MDKSLTKQIRSARLPKISRRSGESMGWTLEIEPDGQGDLVTTRTYFLVGSECRFTCSMCDLWKYTLAEPQTPAGSLTLQIEKLHQRVANEGTQKKSREWLKLYNASNFFDPINVDPSEYESIANQCHGFERVVVENHAALFASEKTKSSSLRFRDSLDGDLEIALGLETIDPAARKWLNKSMSLDQFAQAVDFLCSEAIKVRAFVLLQPLGTPLEDSVQWAVESCRWAAHCGVQRVCLIPTRTGNGFIEQIAKQIAWQPPTAQQLESAFEKLLQDPTNASNPDSSRVVYTVDLWDWDSILGKCSKCSQPRNERLKQMNHSQRFESDASSKSCDCDCVEKK
jgi:radical SAM enzyme (TIGR01210 family)